MRPPGLYPVRRRPGVADEAERAALLGFGGGSGRLGALSAELVDNRGPGRGLGARAGVGGGGLDDNAYWWECGGGPRRLGGFFRVSFYVAEDVRAVFVGVTNSDAHHLVFFGGRIYSVWFVLRVLSTLHTQRFRFFSIFASVSVSVFLVSGQDAQKPTQRPVVDPVCAQVERARSEVQKLVQKQRVPAHVQRRQPHVQTLEALERPEPEPGGPERESP